jgi:hypothetical protein
MSDYDTWEGERERLLHGAGDADRERVAELLDAAAESTRRSRLGESARALGELRGLVVDRGLFRSWDEGIWAFSSLIRLIRAMSPEPQVPPAYQAFLDAIPSASMNTRMSSAQKTFWYGSSEASIGGEIRILPSGAGKGCAVLLRVLLPLGTLVTSLIFIK